MWHRVGVVVMLAGTSCSSQTSGTATDLAGESMDAAVPEEDLARPENDQGGGGACNGSCSGGQSCVNGQCVCPVYQHFCASACIPITVDPDNCGGCGVVCGPMEACSGGRCETSCLPGLSICNRSCADTKTDNQNCGGCNMPCPANQGCVDGMCKPAVVVSPPPSGCVGGGPPIVVTGANGDPCAGNLAQTTFTWALCSCADVNSSQTFLTDAFDSTMGPYKPGGIGGGVGANAQFISSSSADVGGTLTTASATGLKSSSTLTARGELHAGGPAMLKTNTVGHDAYVNGNVTGNSVTIGGTLYQPMGATHPGVTAAAFVEQMVSVSPPCECDPAKKIPVAAIVAARQNNNDDAAVGLDPAIFTTAGAPQRLDLPCGNYYLTGIQTSIPIVIAVHGHTALYIDGDLVASSPVSITLDPTAELDIFVAGTVKASSKLSIGSPNYPALCRTYVGGTVALALSSNVSLATNLYDATAQVLWSAPVEVYGSVFAGDFRASQAVKIHFDRQVVQAGQDCPPPAADGGTPGCGSCEDCGNQACINGTCGACTDSSQCCPPLVCFNGSCELQVK